MKVWGKLFVATIGAFCLLQVVRPGISSHQASSEIKASPQVLHILQKDCYSCHSDEGRLSWFDEIVPGYWIVRHDVLTAREHLNFSTIGSRPEAAQKAALYEAANMVQLGAMPLRSFTAFHPDARVSPQELATLKNDLAPWSANIEAAQAADAAPFRANLQNVSAELNGVPFAPDFEQWKPISFTDRGDNNTLRFILGNAVAIKAVQSGDTLPWPDGARLAKIAWQKARSADGLIHPGSFIQVELMTKNATLYKQSEGWGWGRWRGEALKPYGADAHFANECTGCHEPLRGNDFVYTLPISTANASAEEVLNNKAAALPQNLPYQPLAWSAITMFVDPRSHTMATLYGNDLAANAIRQANSGPIALMQFPSGSVVALVSWAQREDPHWFGGRIADAVRSVEFVQPDDAGKLTVYRRYDGANLQEHSIAPETSAKLTSFITALTPAWLP